MLYICTEGITSTKKLEIMSGRITKLQNAKDVGYKESADYYVVGEGSISIDRNDDGDYCIFDTRDGWSTDYVDTLTEARKELRKYLNEEKVLIVSETKFEDIDLHSVWNQ